MSTKSVVMGADVSKPFRALTARASGRSDWKAICRRLQTRRQAAISRRAACMPCRNAGRLTRRAQKFRQRASCFAICMKITPVPVDALVALDYKGSGSRLAIVGDLWHEPEFLT